MDPADKVTVIREIDVMNTETQTAFGQRNWKLLKRPGCANRDRDTGQSAFNHGWIGEIRRAARADHDLTIRVLPQVFAEESSEMAVAADNQHPSIHSTMIAASDRIHVFSPATLKPTKRYEPLRVASLISNRERPVRSRCTSNTCVAPLLIT